MRASDEHRRAQSLYKEVVKLDEQIERASDKAIISKLKQQRAELYNECRQAYKERDKEFKWIPAIIRDEVVLPAIRNNDFLQKKANMIGSQIVQEVAKKTWDAFSVARKNGGQNILSFKPSRNNMSVSNQANASNMYVRGDNFFYFRGASKSKKFIIKMDLHEDDIMHKFYLDNAGDPTRIKRVALIRRAHNNGWRYYVLVTMRGSSPVAARKSAIRATDGTAGLDMNLSQAAVASPDSMRIIPLGLKNVFFDYKKEQARLSRKFHRQMRINSPHAFAGKKRIKSQRISVWTNGMKNTRIKMRAIARQYKDRIKNSHG